MDSRLLRAPDRLRGLADRDDLTAYTLLRNRAAQAPGCLETDFWLDDFVRELSRWGVAWDRFRLRRFLGRLSRTGAARWAHGTGTRPARIVFADERTYDDSRTGAAREPHASRTDPARLSDRTVQDKDQEQQLKLLPDAPVAPRKAPPAHAMAAKRILQDVKVGAGLPSTSGAAQGRLSKLLATASDLAAAEKAVAALGTELVAAFREGRVSDPVAVLLRQAGAKITQPVAPPRTNGNGYHRGNGHDAVAYNLPVRKSQAELDAERERNIQCLMDSGTRETWDDPTTGERKCRIIPISREQAEARNPRRMV